MDIRIQTPDNEHCSEPTDEEYIYAPFDGDADTTHGEITEEEETYSTSSNESDNDAVIEAEEVVVEPVEEVITPEDNDNPFADMMAENLVEEEIVEEAIETVPKTDYEALMDRYQRLISDWDNYRRRSAEEVQQAKNNANRNLVEALIPTFDHFGFALSHSQSMEDNPAAQEVAKGFEAIYRAMVDSLGREGLEIIDPAPGTPFDMNDNQAIEQVPDTGMKPESVVKVIQVGYKFNGYVIRPAMVAVAS